MSNKVFKIFFDPGHRNTKLDWGASGNGLREAELTLKIVKYAVEYLNTHYSGFEVRQTRTSNEQIVDLNKRDDLADNWGADVFVSVHTNAGGGVGFETFRYNGKISERTISLQNILHGEILSAMRQFGNVKDRGKKAANHSVTRETNAPSILTENLFIDSSDSRYLKSEEFLRGVGEAHGRGVAKFLGLPQKTVEEVNEKETNKKYRIRTGVFSDYETALKIKKLLEQNGVKVVYIDEE